MASFSGEPSATRENSMTTEDIPRLITSFGPAGSKLSVREAGENILDNFCHGYPNRDIHSIIPTFFSGNITELMDPRPNITRKEEEKRRGREINQEGEKHEYAVFNLFSRLIQQPDISPTLLIMRTFEMDTKNPLGLKRTALMSELPKLNLQSAVTTAENDFVALIKDYGVVFIEAKGSTKDNNIRSAEKQLKNVSTIVQSVIKAMTGDKQRFIPTVMLIVVPDCVDPSPTEKTPQGSYYLFRDSCDNFEQKWTDVVNELRELKSSNPFSSDEFKVLSQILVGIWSANAVCVTNEGVRKNQLEQNEADFSYVKQLEETDAVVGTSDVRNESHFKLKEEKLNPYTDIVRTTEEDIFRTCNHVKLCYLTPAQKEIFDHHKQALIHGVGGSGKSLILLFKVLDLVNTSEFSILILAPPPHNIRIYNLRSNNVSVEMIEKFPPSSSMGEVFVTNFRKFFKSKQSTQPASNVFVMDIKKFFKVKRITLMNYDLSNYHFFLDDGQHMKLNSDTDDDVSYFHVGDFIERTYETSLQYNKYFWFMLDVMQGNSHDKGTGKSSVDLFMTPDAQQRTYNIPLIQLQHAMRNTSEVMQLTNEIRKKYEPLYKSASPPTPQVGHRVTSRVPLRHQLQPGTDNKYRLPFITARLRDELKSVTKPPYSLPLSSVAIIWDKVEYFNEHKKAITSFLLAQFSTTAQSIEQQLTSNNSRDIIMDVVDNVMSFESPVVVFISSGVVVGYVGGRRLPYNICTRARVSLTLIDVSRFSYFDHSNNVNTVKWKPDNNTNNTFIKYT